MNQICPDCGAALGDGTAKHYCSHARPFTVKDSGKRAHFETGMQRDAIDGKPLFELLIPENQPYRETLLYRWAMHMAAGAKKYTRRNWEQAATQEELERFKSSALRHMMAWMAGERDEDHAAACCFNLMGAEYVLGRLK